MTKELVEVVQADRILFRDLLGLDVTEDTNRILSGEFDAHWKMQSISRHRLSAEAAIVAWLREQEATRIAQVGSVMSGGGSEYDIGRATAYGHAADTLEQGKHRHG